MQRMGINDLYLCIFLLDWFDILVHRTRNTRCIYEIVYILLCVCVCLCHIWQSVRSPYRLKGRLLFIYLHQLAEGHPSFSCEKQQQELLLAKKNMECGALHDVLEAIVGLKTIECFMFEQSICFIFCLSTIQIKATSSFHDFKLSFFCGYIFSWYKKFWFAKKKYKYQL